MKFLLVTNFTGPGERVIGNPANSYASLYEFTQLNAQQCDFFSRKLLLSIQIIVMEVELTKNMLTNNPWM